MTKEDFTIKNGVYVSPDKKFKLRERKGRNMEMMPPGVRGIWISTKTKDFDKAIEFAQKYMETRGFYTGKPVTFGGFAKDFFIRTDDNSYRARKERFGKHHTKESYESQQCFLDYAIEAFGKYELQSISAIQIEYWYASLAGKRVKEFSSSSKMKALSALSIVFDEAKRLQLIKENPVSLVEKIKVSCKKKEIFKAEEIALLFPEDRQALLYIWDKLIYALYFSIVVDTGWRPSEVSALKYENIIGKGIYTYNGVDTTGKPKEGIKTTEKGKDVKFGILSDYTLALLEEYRQCNNDDGYIFYGKVKTSSSIWYRRFKKALEKAGVPERGRSPYCLRHTFDTYMLDKTGQYEGLTEEVVRELMAHTGYRPEYDHRTPEQMIARLERLKPLIDDARKVKALPLGKEVIM